MLHNKCESCTLEKLQIKAKTKQHKERKKKEEEENKDETTKPHLASLCNLLYHKNQSRMVPIPVQSPNRRVHSIVS